MRSRWPSDVWFALIAIALLCTSFAAGMISRAELAEFSYQKYAADSAKADAKRAYEYEKRDCLPLAFPARDKCVNEQEYAAQQAEHNDRDLEAQRTSASWTHSLGVAGIIGTSFGFLGIALVLLTFRENKRAADAAHDANRPWIEGEVPSGVAIDLTADGIKLSAEVGLLNHGKSPAVNVLAQARLVVVSNRIAQGKRAETIPLSGIEAALDEWERIHGARGKVVYPNRPDKSVIVAELPIDEIRKAEGDPAEEVLYLLAVGLSYRFGTKKGRTVVAYLLRLKNTATLSRFPYKIADNVTELVKSYQVILTDTHEGYAT